MTDNPSRPPVGAGFLAFGKAARAAADVVNAFVGGLTRDHALEVAMARVARVTEAPPDTLAQLRAAAIRTAPPESIHSAAQAAEAVHTLAKAGLTTDYILATGLAAVQQVADNSGASLPAAAELVATLAVRNDTPDRPH